MERRSRGTGAPRFLAGVSESAAVDVDNVPLMLRMVELVVLNSGPARRICRSAPSRPSRGVDRSGRGARAVLLDGSLDQRDGSEDMLRCGRAGRVGIAGFQCGHDARVVVLSLH